MSNYTLYLGDCLEVMPTIPAGSVDAIIADWPYGTTACKWDSIIPLEPLWKECKRVIKRNGAIVLCSQMPFTAILWASNQDWYKYDYCWYKNMPSGFQLSNIQPMRSYEQVLVFYQRQPTYNPVFRESRIKDRKIIDGAKNGGNHKGKNWHNLGTKPQPTYMRKMVKPTNFLDFPCVPRATGTLHPTQKPVALMEYLIRTYTNPGDLVLDNTFGSCSTGAACLNTGRRFIGIEKDPDYFRIGQERMERVERELRGEQLTIAGFR